MSEWRPHVGGAAYRRCRQVRERKSSQEAFIHTRKHMFTLENTCSHTERHVHTWTQMFTHRNTCSHTETHVHTWNTCSHTETHVHTRKHMFTPGTHVHTQKHMFTHGNTCSHMETHVHTQKRMFTLGKTCSHWETHVHNKLKHTPEAYLHTGSTCKFTPDPRVSGTSGNACSRRTRETARTCPTTSSS